MSQRAKPLGAVGVLVAPVLLLLTAGQSDGAATMPSCPATKLTRTGNQTSQLNRSATDSTWNLTGTV